MRSAPDKRSLLYVRPLLEALEPRYAPAVYEAVQLFVNGEVEFRLFKNGFHFQSVLETPGDSVVARSRPDLTDPNAFGLSGYLGPYIARGAPVGNIISVVASDTGVVVDAQGPVATLNGTFGSWQTRYTFTYDEMQQRVNATGTLDVTLNGPLSQVNADLTVSLLASNLLLDVPLQSGGIGDTGDSTPPFTVNYGGTVATWNPETQPSHFPGDRTASLTITVPGAANVVDTLAQNRGFQIAHTRKPGVTQTITATASILSFGGTFDTARAQDFAADNLGILTIINQNATSATSFHFDITYEAVPGPPIAQSDIYELREGTTFTTGSRDVLDNDLAAFPANLRANLVSGPQNGTLNLNPDGSFTYTPNAGFLGIDQFRYRANDGGIDGSIATVTLAVRRDSTVFGTDRGSLVIARNARTQAESHRFEAFPGFGGGVAVAPGDVTGDGIPDIIAGAGNGGGSHVKVFDGASGALIRSFFAFEGFNGPLSVASGDITGDGREDIVVGAPVNGHVKVFDGATGALIRSFLAFEGFNGAVAVGTGDIDGDGREDLLVGAAVNGHVKAFDGRSNGTALFQSFLAFTGYAGAVNVAGGDTDGDGFAEILVGAGMQSPHVKVFDGRSQIVEASFLAYTSANVGVRLASTDVTGDGREDVIITPAAPVPHVKHFAGGSFAEVASFLALDPVLGVGLFVGAS